MADRVCAEVAKGKAVREVGRMKGMPSAATIHKWVVQDEDGFAERYARARHICCQMLIDEIVGISDDSEGDPQRDRLRVDTRKWLACKVIPKMYGDKLQVGGAEGLPPIRIDREDSGL